MKIDWRGGLLTAFVVGSILNIINQWDALFLSTGIAWSKAILTYIVPFCVYQFGRYRASRAQKALQV